MRYQRTAILVGFTLFTLAGLSLGWAEGPSGQAVRASGLPFSRNLDATLDAAKASGKPVVVSFVAAWCPVCARMRKEAFRDPAVVALADQFLWVMVDIDRNLTMAEEYGVEGVPLIYLMDSQGQTRAKLLGLQEPRELQDHLTQFLEILEPSPGSQPGQVPALETDRPKSSLIWKPKGYRSRAICFSHVGYGPLPLFSQSPFQALRLGIRPRTPSTLGKGQYEFRTTSTWVNVWGPSDDTCIDPPSPSRTCIHFLDFEMLQPSVSVAYGITDTVEIEAEIQDRSRFGGEMDGFIQGFHDTFSIDQDRRDEIPKGEFTFELTPPGRQAVVLDSGDRGSFTRSLQVSVQHNVTCGVGSIPAFSYSGTARVETEDAGDLSGGSDLDLGVSVAVARKFGKCYLYGTLGYAWFGRDNFRGIELDDTQYTALAALEWKYWGKQSLLLQYLLTEGLIEDFADFSKTSNEITFGWKWEVIQRGILEIGLIENIVSFDNSPDFGVHLGFSRRF